MMDVEKCVCVLMISICINGSESNMAEFLSEYRCIFVCIVVWDCR